MLELVRPPRPLAEPQAEQHSFIDAVSRRDGLHAVRRGYRPTGSNLPHGWRGQLFRLVGRLPPSLSGEKQRAAAGEGQARGVTPILLEKCRRISAARELSRRAGDPGSSDVDKSLRFHIASHGVGGRIRGVAFQVPLSQGPSALVGVP